MFRFLFILLFISVFGFISKAEAKATYHYKLDSGKVALRNFNEAALSEYKSDRDFNYGDVKIDVSPSLWDRFWRWFWNLFGRAFSNAASGGTFKYILIALGAAAIIFAIIKLAGMDLKMILTGKSKSIELPFTESLENIHEISFEEEIEQAINKGNYRLAVRLLYLKSLKKLSDAGRIKWQPDKTNSEYLNELINPAQKNSFRSLTYQFEYVWYGDFPVDKDGFNRINTSFNDFNKGHY